MMIKIFYFCVNKKTWILNRHFLRQVIMHFFFLILEAATGGGPASLLKKESLAQAFSCEFCEISKNTFSAEHFQTTASIISSFVSFALFVLTYNVSLTLLEIKLQTEDIQRVNQKKIGSSSREYVTWTCFKF